MKDVLTFLLCFFGWHKWKPDPDYGPFHSNPFICERCELTYNEATRPLG